MNEDFSAQGTAGEIREVYKVPNGVRKANHLFFFLLAQEKETRGMQLKE